MSIYFTASKLNRFADEFSSLASDDAFIKISYIRKLPNGKYRVFSEKGKNLGTYDSEKEAKKRLRQIEYFKHLDKIKKKSSSKSDLDEESYSSIMRNLNKYYDEDVVNKFRKAFKKAFDKACLDGYAEPEVYALEIAKETLPSFDDASSLKKSASAIDMGDPSYAGKYLADLLKFILRRVSLQNRQRAINNLKKKVYYLNEFEIASKRTPPGAAIGHSLTLLKTLLIEHNPQYIRAVLNAIVKNL